MTPAQRDNILDAHSAAMARIAELEAERDKLLSVLEGSNRNARRRIDENALLRKALQDNAVDAQAAIDVINSLARIPEPAK